MEALANTFGAISVTFLMGIFSIESSLIKKPDYSEFNGDVGDPET